MGVANDKVEGKAGHNPPESMHEFLGFNSIFSLKYECSGVIFGNGDAVVGLLYVGIGSKYVGGCLGGFVYGSNVE